MHLPTGNTYGRPEGSYMDEITEHKTVFGYAGGKQALIQLKAS